MIKFDYLLGKYSSTLMIERLICALVKHEIKSIEIESNHFPTIFSVLYPFSIERIASAIANLCNNEVIIVNYEIKEMDFTPLFMFFISTISKEFVDDKLLDKLEIDSDGIVSSNEDKTKIMHMIEPKVNFWPLINYIDLKVSKNE